MLRTGFYINPEALALNQVQQALVADEDGHPIDSTELANIPEGATPDDVERMKLSALSKLQEKHRRSE